MSRIRLIIAAWLLLLVPTLLIGAMALRLVRNQQRQLVADSRAATAQRAQSAAENLDLAVTEVREGLLASLRQLPEENLADRLDDWKQDNPLIRNVFIWGPDGLILPDPQRPASSEESAFIARYDALFQGRIPWQSPPADAPSEETGSVFTPSSPRRELRKLTEQPAVAAMETAAAAPLASGWVPWFWEDGLFLLGWIEKPAGSGRRFGLEVEMMALLSRLVTSLPAAPPGEIWTLVDGRGRVVHRTGTGELPGGDGLLAEQPIGPGLPHWQLRIYTLEKAGGEGGSGLRVLSTLLVGSFVAAILFGGSLLLWQAYRHMLDARRKTSFVANVSHELKTPLTTIRMYAELLAEGGVKQPDRQQHYLQVITGESRRLTRLVNNVLDFGRLEQGRKQYHYSRIHVPPHLDDILDSQEIRLAQAGLQLVRRIPRDIPAVLADRDAIRQALLNLIDNALKYAAGGGVLEVELSLEDGHCRIAVKDRGPGVPATHRERIFQAFHRVDDSLTASCPGSGLGLSIARRLLRGMGGDLRYRPRRNGGSCFEMLLPLAPDGAEKPDGADSGPDGP
jgi:signal transduction histidine kinase/cell division protein FtsL